MFLFKDGVCSPVHLPNPRMTLVSPLLSLRFSFTGPACPHGVIKIRGDAALMLVSGHYMPLNRWIFRLSHGS